MKQDFNEASKTEQLKVISLKHGLERTDHGETVPLELYFDTGEELIVEIVHLQVSNDGPLIYRLTIGEEIYRADTIEKLWLVELQKWSWGCKKFNIERTERADVKHKEGKA